MLAIMESNRKFPLAAINITDHSHRPCLYALDSVRFNNLFDVFISWTSCGVILLLSIINFMSFISPRFNHVPRFPWVFKIHVLPILTELLLQSVLIHEKIMDQNCHRLQFYRHVVKTANICNF